MELTKRDIRRLAEGDRPFSLGDQPFIVMRESISMPIVQEQSWQWSVRTSPDSKDATVIDRNTAVEIIRRNGMKRCLSINCGQIYEKAGQPFLKRYGRRKEDMAS